MEVLELTSGELEGIFISISSLQQMHKHIFINVDRIGVLNNHKRVSWFTFIFLPRVMLSVFVENKSV